jgi:hypothetical protein
MLPADYRAVVLDGVRVLRQVATELRVRAADAPGEPTYLLALRDVSGLADRLDGLSGWEWRGGFASLSVTPQDVAVLRELAAGADARSPYRDASRPAVPLRGAALRALARFLDRYLAHEFAFEDAPADAQPDLDAPAS